MKSCGVYSGCNYTAGSSELLVYLVAVNGRADFRHASSKVEARSEHRVTVISGLGDGAFESVAAGGGSIEFYKGDTLVSVVMLGRDVTARSANDGVRRLAKIAAGRV